MSQINFDTWVIWFSFVHCKFIKLTVNWWKSVGMYGQLLKPTSWNMSLQVSTGSCSLMLIIKTFSSLLCSSRVWRVNKYWFFQLLCHYLSMQFSTFVSVLIVNNCVLLSDLFVLPMPNKVHVSCKHYNTLS